MYDERKCKTGSSPVCECDKYGFCPWDAEDGTDCYFWCGWKPDQAEPPEPVRGYARSGL